MYTVESYIDAQTVMKLAIYAGEMMLTNGAEIYRVEDTMERMLGSCENIEDIQVVCTYSSIMASFEYKEEIITSIRKIRNIGTNMEKIADVNDFSRYFVSKDVVLEDQVVKLVEIDQKNGLSQKSNIFAFSTASAFFTLAMGGSLVDFIATFLICSFSQYLNLKTADQGRKYFMDTLFSSLIISSLALLTYELGVPIKYNLVITGSIYLLFPGVSLTNSVRDFMNRDLLAGTIGILQAVFTAAALAIGVGLVILIHSKVAV